MPLTFLTGGARSGKSSVAVQRAQRSGLPVVFVATGEARDAEMADRIARHRAERPEVWATVEAPLDLAEACEAIEPGHAVIVDCLSLWVSNLMGRAANAPEDHVASTLEPTTLAAAHAVGRWAAAYPGLVVVVTNEVGSGIVPMHPVSRGYRDLLGRVNATVAGYADLAQLVVSGRTLTLDPTED